jgi:hypothetical protein
MNEWVKKGQKQTKNGHSREEYSLLGYNAR